MQHGTDGSHAAAECHRRLGLFQLAELAFQGSDCRVAHAAVDVAGQLALRHVVPGIDVVVAVGGTDHDRGLGSVVRMLNLLPAPHHTRTDTGRCIALEFLVLVHIRFPHR